MSERRRQPRVRCKLACQLRLGDGKPVEGTVLDLSRSGLCVQTTLPADQGDPLVVLLRVPDDEIEVQALAWHSRRARRCGTGEVCHLLGLIVSEAPERYYQLAPVEPKPATAAPFEVGPEAPAAGKSASGPSRVSPDDVEDLIAFRVRVKVSGEPRTRVLSLSAASDEDARAAAAANLGNTWEILEVWAA